MQFHGTCCILPQDKELEAIRRAHANRLERLRAVQHSEKLLQEQIKTYEDHQPGCAWLSLLVYSYN